LLSLSCGAPGLGGTGIFELPRLRHCHTVPRPMVEPWDSCVRAGPASGLFDRAQMRPAGAWQLHARPQSWCNHGAIMVGRALPVAAVLVVLARPWHRGYEMRVVGSG
jgi:hypothetical protein